MLGGAATYISLAASYFTKTSLVAVVGEDFAAEDTELLEDHGVDLEGLERLDRLASISVRFGRFVGAPAASQRAIAFSISPASVK